MNKSRYDKSGKTAMRAAGKRGCAVCEALERRVVLSAAAVVATLPASVQEIVAHPMYQAARPIRGGQPLNSSAPPAGATTPGQMRHFYGVDGVNFGGIIGDGHGQTIAIVDAYDDPNALSDLQHFDSYYGLPDPPSFQQFNQSGQLLAESGGTAVAPSKGRHSGWQIEESLDIEWAHVIAPAAKIALIECNSASSDLDTGVSAAAGLPNVASVSMSWGSNESFGENSDDGTFAAAGVTYLAATGDGGASSTSYPAASVNVIAVGGTTRHFAAGTTDGTFGSEVAWSGTGGEISPYESKPSYQNSVLAGSHRGTPDVSMDADPSTGVAIYDSYDFGTSTPWAQYGGTSLATPMWAGLIAIVDQGRAGASLGPLSGRSQALPQLYALPQGDFHDITSGSNGTGNNAGPGYDTVSGIGTPVANKLLNGLAGVGAAAPATQLAFSQAPSTAVAGANIDSPGGVKVAVQDGSGNTVTSDFSTVMLTLTGGMFAGGGTTASIAAVNGIATFTGLTINASGSYTLTASDGSLAPITSASFTVTAAGANKLVFGVGPTDTRAGAAVSPAVIVDVEDQFGNLVTAASTVTLTLSTGTFHGGSAIATAPVVGGVATFSSLEIDDAGSYTLMASDGAVISATSGSFIVTLSNVITGTGGDDSIMLIENGDGQHIDWTMGSFTGRVAIGDSNGLTINGNGGNDVITMDYNNGSPLPGMLHLNGTFTINGLQGVNPLAGTTLEIGQSTLYVGYAAGQSPISLIQQALADGYNAGGWNGAPSASIGAITSTAAASGSANMFGIGYADSADGIVAGQPGNTVEIRYTVMGDSNLDRVVDATDAVTMARNYLIAGKSAWDLGNFNYDSIINMDDALILQKNFNGTAVVSASPATVSAAAALAGASVTGASAPATPEGKTVDGSGSQLVVQTLAGGEEVTKGHLWDRRGRGR